MRKPTKETTNKRVLAGLLIKNPKFSCHPPNSNQGALQEKKLWASPWKIKNDAKAKMPPAVATERRAAILPCFLKNNKVNRADSRGRNNKLKATCIIL